MISVSSSRGPRVRYKVDSESGVKALIRVPLEGMLAMEQRLRKVEQQLGASGVLVGKEG